MKMVSVIGSGFSGLSAACYAAKFGYAVTVFEKNETVGGRARHFCEQGFTFDMGPSWYWMPDVFERMYNDFGKTTSDFYELKKLDPGFQIFFGDGSELALPAELDDVYALFESIEKGSSDNLRNFLREGEYKYKVGMLDLAYKPSLSWMEFLTLSVIKGASKTHLLTSMKDYVRTFFKDERLIKLMEFPVLFLGAMPDKIPALYSLMNYSAISQGTFYPQGGMLKIVEGLQSLAESLNVKFECTNAVERILTEDNQVTGLKTHRGIYKTDAVIASADYHHVEKALLRDTGKANYSEAYWNKKTFAPSCLIFYLGVNKKIKKLLHHNLFFDSDFEAHSREIYDTPEWPSDPLFYVCCPSKTDDSVAPQGMENLFLLVPIAPGIKDSEEIREKYFKLLITRLEKITDDQILSNIVYKRSYCLSDFMMDYNSYKGNAYGLANTLRQTAFMKPSLKSKKLSNLFYAGQLTVPGPGVPPALISGKIAAEQLKKHWR